MIPELHGTSSRTEHRELVRDLEAIAPALDTRSVPATQTTSGHHTRLARAVRRFRRGLASMLESAGNAIAPETVRHHETSGR